VKCKCGNNNINVRCHDRDTKNKCIKICNLINKCDHTCTVKCHNHELDPFICNNKCFKYKSNSCNHLCNQKCHYGNDCE